MWSAINNENSACARRRRGTCLAFGARKRLATLLSLQLEYVNIQLAVIFCTSAQESQRRQRTLPPMMKFVITWPSLMIQILLPPQPYSSQSPLQILKSKRNDRFVLGNFHGVSWQVWCLSCQSIKKRRQIYKIFYPESSKTPEKKAFLYSPPHEGFKLSAMNS